jgi:hypothetical protein
LTVELDGAGGEAECNIVEIVVYTEHDGGDGVGGVAAGVGRLREPGLR